MRDAFKYAAQLLLYLSRSFWCDVHLIIVPAPCFRPYLQGAGPFIARKYDYFPVVGSDRINDMTVSDSHPRHVGYCQNLDFACLQAKQVVLPCREADRSRQKRQATQKETNKHGQGGPLIPHKPQQVSTQNGTH